MSDPLRTAILSAADALEAARSELCRLDAVAGDGDHGVTMAMAARAVRPIVTDAPADTRPADLLVKVAAAVGSVGGAIGPIWATALLRVAATLRSRADDTPFGVGDLRRCAEAAEAAIVALGGAKPGDKTILDALHPLVEALSRAESDGTALAPALALAARAARQGAETTADMIATVGRASRLGERGLGSPDPGATSLAIVVEALVASVSESPGRETMPA